MNSLFDIVPERRNTHSYKWDQVEALFGSDDILPLWVADMDFASPVAVQEALLKRVQVGNYGYTVRSDAYIAAIVGWLARRHKWKIEPQWLIDVPGVVTSLTLAVEQWTEPGDQVIIQTPIYYPFFDVVTQTGRVIADNPLVIRDGRYEMDFDHLEQLMQNGAKVLLFCSPHNPSSRVWERAELERLAELCDRYNVLVISDEIHADLALPGHQHIPFASLSEDTAQRTITAMAPTKTFNMPGLHSSYVVIPNAKHRRAFDQRIRALSLHMMNFFNVEAVVAAYNESEAWLDELLPYIQGNIDWAYEYIREKLPLAQPFKPDGTYLLWVDLRAYVASTDELKQIMYKKAKVAFNEGSIYGKSGARHVRINVACPRERLVEALQRFVEALLVHHSSR